MATFRVKMTYVGSHVYEVEADNADEAETIAQYEVAHCEDFTSGYFEVARVDECHDLNEKPFLVVGYDHEGTGHIIDIFKSESDARECLVKCAEGDDKYEPWEYYIENAEGKV